MAFNQPYQQNFTNVLSEDEFLTIIQPTPPQTPQQTPPTENASKEDETREAEEAEELIKKFTEDLGEDELDKELRRQDAIYEQDRRRDARRLARRTPQQLEEARRRHEHDVDRARARIRINEILGEESSSRDRVLTRLSTPRSIIRQPQNITIAEPVRDMNQQYIANSLPRARATRPQQGLYF